MYIFFFSHQSHLSLTVASFPSSTLSAPPVPYDFFVPWQKPPLTPWNWLKAPFSGAPRPPSHPAITAFPTAPSLLFFTGQVSGGLFSLHPQFLKTSSPLVAFERGKKAWDWKVPTKAIHGSNLDTFFLILWRRKWQPTPVLLPGESHGQRNLSGYSPWSCKELDTVERLHFLCEQSCILPGCTWDFSGKNIGVVGYFLLQWGRVFLTQESNPRLMSEGQVR